MVRQCPVEATLAVIGGKRKPLIIFYSLQGTKRFNELRRMVPAVPQPILDMMLEWGLRQQTGR